MRRIQVVGLGVTGTATAKALKMSGNEVLVYDVDESKREEFEKEGFEWNSRSNQDVHYVVYCVTEWNIEKAMAEWAVKCPFSDHVIRSTVKPGTADRLRKLVYGEIISHPEFLRASQPLFDAVMPDKMLIGCCNYAHYLEYREVWRELIPDDSKFIRTDNTTAEFTKLASNTILAGYVSLWNQIKLVADKVDINSHEVASILTLDPRISWYGSIHGKPYGGFCLPKDLKQMTEIAENVKNTSLLEAIKSINDTIGEK